MCPHALYKIDKDRVIRDAIKDGNNTAIEKLKGNEDPNNDVTTASSTVDIIVGFLGGSADTVKEGIVTSVVDTEDGIEYTHNTTLAKLVAHVSCERAT